MQVLPEELKGPKPKGKKRKAKKAGGETGVIAPKQGRLGGGATDTAASNDSEAYGSGTTQEPQYFMAAGVPIPNQKLPPSSKPSKAESIVGQPVYKIIQSSSSISALHEYSKKGKKKAQFNAAGCYTVKWKA